MRDKWVLRARVDYLIRMLSQHVTLVGTGSLSLTGSIGTATDLVYVTNTRMVYNIAA